MRWLYHLVRTEELGWGSDGRYRPASLSKEGFIHASYASEVLNSARLYFSAADDFPRLKVMQIDPRRVDVRVDVASTPRGPMPHIVGGVPVDACVKVLSLANFEEAPDRVTGTKIGFVAFEGMTLLDLVGPLDVLSRIATMGFDRTMSCEVIALTRPPTDQTVTNVVTWTGAGGSSFTAARYRPALDVFDVLIVPGGPDTRALMHDEEVARYLTSYPHNRLTASVCTGALLLAAAGRLHGRRATTHASAFDQLASFSEVTVVRNERVVDEGHVITAAGVTAGIDLGLHLVERLEGEAVAREIAARIEWHHRERTDFVSSRACR